MYKRLNKKVKNFLCLSVFACFYALPINSFAAFNLTVRPYEGGNDLRFDKVSNFEPFTSKELIVDVTSDIGKRYQLIQTLLDPLTNNAGVTLPQNSFIVYGIRGSNKYGNLSAEQESPVSVGRTIIYTSDTSGLTDSLKLIFMIKNTFQATSGSYRGRIALTLEPIDSNLSSVTAIVNVFADISVESSVEMKTVTGSKIISLDLSREEKRFSEVGVNIKGETGAQFRIFQQLSEIFESSDGNRLPPDAVNFWISGSTKGSGPAQAIPLSNRKDMVYESSARGETDNFTITYGLTDSGNLRAGLYRSNIKYTLEGLNRNELLSDFGFEVTVPRIFELNITPELGGTIQFRDVKAKEPPKVSEVVIEVKSNIGKPYQVSQQLLAGLVNKDGKSIPVKNFTLREVNIQTKGSLRYTTPTEVRTGDMVLFASDAQGASDKFKVVYELIPSLDIEAGDYSSRFTYSISEI